MNVKNCPVCKSIRLKNFLHRHLVAVHQHLLVKDRESARTLLEGELDLAVCEECGFVFNCAFDPSKLKYGEAYDNTQDCSPSFKTHLSCLVHRLIYECGIQSSRIVEIGCGKGRFLQALVEHPETNNHGYGFDPSYIGPLSLCDGKLLFEQRFYDESCADIVADVVICRHVIEHIPNPVDFLQTIRKALRNSPKARVFFETPCLEWILRNQVVWDFFYEHCSYFTASSLTTAFEQAGFQVNRIDHVFSGQYLWLEASIAKVPAVIKNAGAVPELCRNYLLAETEIIATWRKTIDILLEEGKVALWGAGAKGVTFANLIDPEMDKLDCVVDLNPMKQNKFIPGAGHAIVNYSDLGKRGVKHAILMNPNYLEENKKIIKETGLQVNLL